MMDIFNMFLEEKTQVNIFDTKQEALFLFFRNVEVTNCTNCMHYY